MSLLPFEKEVASNELKNVISHLIICHEKAPQFHSSIEPIPKKAYNYQHQKKQREREKREAIQLDDLYTNHHLIHWELYIELHYLSTPPAASYGKDCLEDL